MAYESKIDIERVINILKQFPKGDVLTAIDTMGLVGPPALRAERAEQETRIDNLVSYLLILQGLSISVVGHLLTSVREEAMLSVNFERFLRLLIKLALRAFLTDLGMKNGGLTFDFPGKENPAFWVGLEKGFKFEAVVKKTVEDYPGDDKKRDLEKEFEEMIWELGSSLGLKERENETTVECDSEKKELSITIKSHYD